MKVTFASQVPFALDAGGLEIQLRCTAEALRGVGVEVELLDPWKSTFDADVLHCFGSDYQLGEVIARASSRGIPLVVSAVFAPHARSIFYKAWRMLDRVLPVKTSFGVRADILREADAVVALTEVEARYLTRFFGAARHKISVIPNGVEERFFKATPEAFEREEDLRNFVLSVASVEALKNQVRLVRALAGTGVPLVLIGAPSSREAAFAAALTRLASDQRDIRWIPGLQHESPLLQAAYAAARVHVLPSFVEAFGLASLEAAAAGANLVMSDLPALRATFGRYAWFCNPRSVASIREAVLGAYRAERGARYTGRPEWLLSWNDVALRLVDVYRSVLDRRFASGA